MTYIRIDKIGLVANFSEVGNWAFDLAFHLSKTHSYQLNIFNFAESPYTISASLDPSKCSLNPEIDIKKQINSEKKMREYYESLLGDFVDVGFKVCNSHRHNLELRHCLKKKDYQLLIIPYIKQGISFGNMPLEEFAYRFISPIILVGPDHPQEYHINEQAGLIIEELEIPTRQWSRIPIPEKMQQLPVI